MNQVNIFYGCQPPPCSQQRSYQQVSYQPNVVYPQHQYHQHQNYMGDDESDSQIILNNGANKLSLEMNCKKKHNEKQQKQKSQSDAEKELLNSIKDLQQKVRELESKLSNCVTKKELENYITKEELKERLENYVTKDELKQQMEELEESFLKRLSDQEVLGRSFPNLQTYPPIITLPDGSQAPQKQRLQPINHNPKINIEENQAKVDIVKTPHSETLISSNDQNTKSCVNFSIKSVRKLNMTEINFKANLN